ncbi:MAG TPA: ABC-2 family transporter protein [Kofleriaceae bacterium]|nr:ABC-2 family transporter protein [Kofleriaceae bacterium]
MTTAGRYTRLLGVQLRAAMQTSMQYRLDFLVEGAMSIYWLAWNLVPLLILYGHRDRVAGWDFPSALVVIGWFTMLRGVLDGAVSPSLVRAVEQIRSGELDYVLLKPADAQFLVSTGRFEWWKVIDVLGGAALVAWSLARLDVVPSAGEVAVAALLLLSGVLVLYSLWILVVCACFWVVRLDNLVYLFDALFDAARWPIHVFRGFWRVLFTFVVPLALMTTYPAMSLLGRLDARTAGLALGGAVLFASVARFLWRKAIRSYTSASS